MNSLNHKLHQFTYEKQQNDTYLIICKLGSSQFSLGMFNNTQLRELANELLNLANHLEKDKPRHINNNWKESLAALTAVYLRLTYPDKSHRTITDEQIEKAISMLLEDESRASLKFIYGAMTPDSKHQLKTLVRKHL